jgi:cell wall assembly regulator SMI1
MRGHVDTVVYRDFDRVYTVLRRTANFLSLQANNVQHLQLYEDHLIHIKLI